MYKIVICKLVDNEEYKKFKENDMYRNRAIIPERYIEDSVTTATLDEEQWKKVQKAIVDSLD